MNNNMFNTVLNSFICLFKFGIKSIQFPTTQFIYNIFDILWRLLRSLIPHKIPPHTPLMVLVLISCAIKKMIINLYFGGTRNFMNLIYNKVFQFQPDTISFESIQKIYSDICSKMGLAVHPCLQEKPKEYFETQAKKNDDFGPRYVQFSNHRLDQLTIQILGLIIKFCPLTALKLSRNLYTHKQIESLKSIITSSKQLQALYFQWNPLNEYLSRKDFFLSTITPNIQYLILREDNLDDEIVTQIFDQILNQQAGNLKALDFSGNKLTDKIGQKCCNFLKEQKSLKYLGLAKNNLKSCLFIEQLLKTITNLYSEQTDNRQNFQLNEISLNRNMFTDESGLILFNMISQINTDMLIHLVSNNFSVGWAKILRQFNSIKI